MSASSARQQSSGLKTRVRAKLSLLAKLQGILVASRKKEDISPDPADTEHKIHTRFTPTAWLDSFENVITDSQGLQAFTEFLKREYSEENIIFWTACKEYNMIVDSKQRKQTAQRIFEKHLDDYAPEPVNVDSSARNTVRCNLSESPVNIFSTAQAQIFALMKTDSYRRFLKSDLSKVPCICLDRQPVELCPCTSSKDQKSSVSKTPRLKSNGFIPRDTDYKLSELPEHLKLGVRLDKTNGNQQYECDETMNLLPDSNFRINKTSHAEQATSDTDIKVPHLVTADCIALSSGNMERVLHINPVDQCHLDNTVSGFTFHVDSPPKTNATSSDEEHKVIVISDGVDQNETPKRSHLDLNKKGDRMRRSISDQGDTMSRTNRVSVTRLSGPGMASGISMTSLQEEVEDDDMTLLSRLSHSLDHLIELESAGVDCRLDKVDELQQLLDNNVLESVEIERFLETAESLTLSTHSLCESCYLVSPQISVEELYEAGCICDIKVETAHIVAGDESSIVDTAQNICTSLTHDSSN